VPSKGTPGYPTRGRLNSPPKKRAETMDCLNDPVYATARARLYVLTRLDEALAGAGASWAQDHRG
jgi:hypothetical protein